MIIQDKAKNQFKINLNTSANTWKMISFLAYKP